MTGEKRERLVEGEGKRVWCCRQVWRSVGGKEERMSFSDGGSLIGGEREGGEEEGRLSTGS